MSRVLVRVCLRGFNLTIMMLGMFIIWECSDLTTTYNFLMIGVYGGYGIVTFGFLLEAGLYQDSDKLIEVSFLISAIALNLLCSVLSFKQFYTKNNEQNHEHQFMSRGFLSLLGVVAYSIDLTFILCSID